MKRKKILVVNEASYLNTGYATYFKNVIPYLLEEFDVAEFSVYANENDERLKTIPWKTYPNMPSDPEKVKIYESHPSHQFGAFRFERVLLDFKPDVVCVPPGELICTNRGYIPIQDVSLQDSVLTHNGRFCQVRKTFKHQYEGKMVSIFANGRKERLKVTEEHPVLVFKKKRQTNQKKSILKIYDGVLPEFVPANTVRKGDLVVLSGYNNTNIETIDITNYLDNYTINNDDTVIPTIGGNRVNRFIKLDRDLGRLIGYLIGDGSWSAGNTTTITFGANEQRFVDDSIKLFKKCFGLIATSKKLKDKEVICVYCNSCLLKEFLVKWIGLKREFKKIPSNILLGHKELKEGTISGLVRSDGYYSKNTVEFDTVHKHLAYEYQYLCSSIGIPVNFGITKISGRAVGENYYSVCGYGDSARELHSIVEKHKEAIGLIDSTTRRPKQTQIINGYMVSAVRNINYSNYNGTVYNLEVDIDNSYHIQGYCVHNCSVRDQWMDTFIQTSPLRHCYNWIWQPTCDGMPQNPEWLYYMSKADRLFTYTKWAKDVIESQANVKVHEVATPCASETYTQANKLPIRLSMGLDPDAFIVGSVMRNQRRKLFPELFEAFSKFNKPNTYLYLHTSYPDAGWDLPELMNQYGIAHKVLFTYVCEHCKNFEVCKFNDTVKQCHKCKNFSSKPASVASGLNDEDLARVYQCMDLYIQAANSEGLGMPAMEACSCGIPVAVTSYSGTLDYITELDAYPLLPAKLYKELETGCMRATLDVDWMARVMDYHYNMSPEKRQEISDELAKQTRLKYNWKNVAQKWIKHIHELPYGKWDSPARVCQFNEPPQMAKNSEFLTWLFTNYLPSGYEYEYEWSCILRDLNFGCFKNNPGGFFYSESSVHNMTRYQPFSRQTAADMLKQKGQANNFWEQARIGAHKLEDEPWLNL